VTVANCGCECISCIFLGTIGKLQDRRNHSLDLLLRRMTISHYGILDLQRSIFGHGDIPFRSRQQCHSADLAQFQRALGVTGKKNLLDAHGVRPVFSDHIVQFPENSLDAGRLIVFHRRLNGPMGDVRQTTPVHLDHAPPGSNGPRVYTKNDFDRITPLFNCLAIEETMPLFPLQPVCCSNISGGTSKLAATL
jgi:hypothetical protein